MYEVEVQDEFSAAHFLKLYDGSWELRHGHNWKVAVTLRANKLDSMGVVVDFEMLKASLRKVLSEFEQTSFNEHPDFKDGKLNPSTENIAQVICHRLAGRLKPSQAKIVRVTVWETLDASASYYPS
ncbi:MAG: 6-carboxytetrahydropterin synthase [Candidatus Omnitrophica bacterium]|nr:6-carboxytetrahydropterin synthase [Candidatus Omnitrophota bacterium]